jgi:adenine-specific DNA-methyltransferase
LDGAHHFTEEGLKHDEERTKFLEGMNIRVIRFENEEVFTRQEAVVMEIRRWFKQP